MASNHFFKKIHIIKPVHRPHKAPNSPAGDLCGSTQGQSVWGKPEMRPLPCCDKGQEGQARQGVLPAPERALDDTEIQVLQTWCTEALGRAPTPPEPSPPTSDVIPGAAQPCQ